MSTGLPMIPQPCILGVYGPNPRFTASAAFGTGQIEAAAELLAERAATLAAGGRVDDLADLRSFVEYGWPERPTLGGRAGVDPMLLVSNTGRASRYVSSLRVEVDGAAIEQDALTLANDSPGEVGTPVRASELDAEHGFYIRRGQEAKVVLGGAAVAPGAHRIRAELGLGGVSSLILDEDVEFVS